MALDAGAGPLQRREPGSADRVEVADREVDVEPERKRGVGATICRDDERPVEVGKRPPRSGGNDDDPFDHSQLPPLALPRSGSRVGGAHVRPLSPVAPSSPYGSANRSAPRTKLVFIAHELSPRFASRCGYSGVTYAAVSPPSTRNVAPFTYDDSSLARKRAALTISRGFASRPIGRWIRRRS